MFDFVRLELTMFRELSLLKLKKAELKNKYEKERQGQNASLENHNHAVDTTEDYLTSKNMVLTIPLLKKVRDDLRI